MGAFISNLLYAGFCLLLFAYIMYFVPALIAKFVDKTQQYVVWMRLAMAVVLILFAQLVKVGIFEYIRWGNMPFVDWLVSMCMLLFALTMFAHGMYNWTMWKQLIDKPVNWLVALFMRK